MEENIVFTATVDLLLSHSSAFGGYLLVLASSAVFTWKRAELRLCVTSCPVNCNVEDDDELNDASSQAWFYH